MTLLECSKTTPKRHPDTRQILPTFGPPKRHKMSFSTPSGHTADLGQKAYTYEERTKESEDLKILVCHVTQLVHSCSESFLVLSFITFNWFLIEPINKTRVCLFTRRTLFVNLVKVFFNSCARLSQKAYTYEE